LKDWKLLLDSTTPRHALALYSASQGRFRQDFEDLSKIPVTSCIPLPQHKPSISTSLDSQVNPLVEEQRYTASRHLLPSSKSVNTAPDYSLFPEQPTSPFFGQYKDNRIDSAVYNDSGLPEAICCSYTSATSPIDAQQPTARLVTRIIFIANFYDYSRCFLGPIARFIEARIIPVVKRSVLRRYSTIMAVLRSLPSIPVEICPRNDFISISNKLYTYLSTEKGSGGFWIAFLVLSATTYVVTQLDGFVFSRLSQIISSSPVFCRPEAQFTHPTNFRGIFRQRCNFFRTPTAEHPITTIPKALLPCA
jgi:hypothetical protein